MRASDPACFDQTRSGDLMWSQGQRLFQHDGPRLGVGSAVVLESTFGSSRALTGALAGTLVLAPLGAALFVWALRSVPRYHDGDTLVTRGAYSWLCNPVYLAFLAMLMATGLLTLGGIKLILSVLLYLAGSELRIASEEGELAEKFPTGYEMYRTRTRWRYLPGIR